MGCLAVGRPEHALLLPRQTARSCLDAYQEAGMIRGLVFAGLLAAHTVSGHELTGHTVLLQPIVLTDDAGDGAAKANLPEELIDLPFRRWDLDFQIHEPVEWSRRAFRDGEIDVDVIVKAAAEEGVFRQPRRIANMFSHARSMGE